MMWNRDTFGSVRRFMLSTSLVLVSLMSVGCSVTEVVVVVDGPPTVVQRAQSLKIQVRDTNNNVVYDETESVAALGTNAFPVTLSLTPSGSEDADFGVLVRMTDSMGDISTYVRTSFIPGKSLRLDIPLFAACRSNCFDMGGQTCMSNGECGAADRDPTLLPEWTGSP